MSSTSTAQRGLRARLERARAGGAYDRFVDRTDNWMLALAALFIVVLVWPVLDENMSPGLRDALYWADITIWLVFVAEYVIRLARRIAGGSSAPISRT